MALLKTATRIAKQKTVEKREPRVDQNEKTGIEFEALLNTASKTKSETKSKSKSKQQRP